MTSDQHRTEPFRVLFVCTGNTCRSPMAAAVARRMARERGWEHLDVRSAGVAASPGTPASAGAVRVGEEVGLDLAAHRSTPLSAELVDAADLILVMSPGHVHRVLELGGQRKVALLSGFAEGGEGSEGAPIPDPFGGDDATYRETLQALEDLIERSLKRLEPILSP